MGLSLQKCMQPAMKRKEPDVVNEAAGDVQKSLQPTSKHRVEYPQKNTCD
jgi:hypothetical protein